jgi:hypothetical protein
MVSISDMGYAYFCCVYLMLLLEGDIEYVKDRTEGFDD